MPRSAHPRVVLVHATPVAMEPIRAAFAKGWPEAETVNILEDSLSIDRAREGDLSTVMVQRFLDITSYAYTRAGADAILFTCSAFGPAIEQAAATVPIPVLKPNEAMFAAALAGGGGQIGMVATFAPSIAPMEAEFQEDARRLRPGATIRTVIAPGAMEALRDGDALTHNRLVAEAARALDGMDAILLAHFSTSRAAAAVRAVVRSPVFTAPDAAVARVRDIVLAA